MTAAAPEALARRRGRCRLCSAPISPGEDYVTKLDRLGWVHASCAAGYRRVLAEHADDERTREEAQ